MGKEQRSRGLHFVPCILIDVFGVKDGGVVCHAREVEHHLVYLGVAIAAYGKNAIG